MSAITGSALVPRLARVTGRVRVPGDKSISHRYAMLAALADGTTRLRNYAPGADCAATLACVAGLGAHVTRGDEIVIDGLGWRGLKAPPVALDCANSGTSMRLLSGILAAHPFHSVLTGDASLSRRPMRRVIEPLTQMGATIDAFEGRPPLAISGTQLRGVTFAPAVPSAQVKSAVLLAGLLGTGRTTVIERVRTRDHTERAYEAFGVHVHEDAGAVSVEAGQRLCAIDADIAGDLSSAMFWMALAAGSPGAELRLEGVGLNPTRLGVLDVLRRAGARITTEPDATTSRGEPSGTILVRHEESRSFEVTPDEVPLLIDEIPALAAIAAMQPGISMRVRGAGELRVKESDRIAMLARGFRALGASVEEFRDGFAVSGGPLEGGEADAAGDHRLAMTFAIAGCRARGPVHLTGADAVAVSYPGFFDELARLAAGHDAPARP